MISDYVIVNPTLEIDFIKHFKQSTPKEDSDNFDYEDFILTNMKSC